MMKCRLRESRLIAINEGERSLTAADVSAVYQINGDETKHSVRDRMLAKSHAGRGTRLPSTWKLARPLNTRAIVLTGLATLRLVSNSESAGINRHVVGDERALQEREQRIHPGLESCRRY